RRIEGSLCPSDVKEVFILVCLDSSYGAVGTDLSPWLSIDENAGFPWAVSLDVLQAILARFDEFEEFRRFLRWRKGVHGRMFNEDEAVFAGYFACHGPIELPSEALSIQLDANYTDFIEPAWFRRRGLDVP